MMNFSNVKNIIVSAAVSGLIAGLVLTIVQHFFVMPFLFEAEVYEQAATEISTSVSPENHENEQWQPEDGIERTFYTALANISMAFSFAMLLGSAILVSGKQTNWLSGLLWGIAGYLVFFVAPALGLPPEVPGTEAAALKDRQLWWLAPVLATAIGLAMLVFPRNWLIKISGLLLLVSPYLIGAPQPEAHGSVAPQSLVASFITAAFITNMIFWLVLGFFQAILTKTNPQFNR